MTDDVVLIINNRKTSTKPVHTFELDALILRFRCGYIGPTLSVFAFEHFYVTQTENIETKDKAKGMRGNKGPEVE